MDAGTLEAVVGAVPNKLPVLPAGAPVADARIKALKMLGGLLLVSPPPNTLPAMVGEERLRFLKKPSPAAVGAENANPVDVVAGVAIPLELAMDGLAVVTCRVCQNIKTTSELSSTSYQHKWVIVRCHIPYIVHWRHETWFAIPP